MLQSTDHDKVEASLRTVEEMLEQRGYVIKKNAVVTGKSGVAHEIAFYAQSPTGQQQLIVSTWFLETKICEEDVIRLFAVGLDVDAVGILVSAGLNMTDNAAKLAKLYGIVVIDACNQEMHIESLQKILAFNK